MKLFSGLGEKILKHRIVSIIALCILLAALGAGGWYGWQQYQYRQSSAFALEKIRQALVPANPHGLSELVDFRTIGQEMAAATAKSFPFLLSGPEQERDINHRLQAALLKKFMDKDSKGSMFKEDESPQVKLARPLEILPSDFASQLADTLTLKNTRPGEAVLSAKVENKQLERTFNLMFDMQKTASGWKVRNLLNARELAGELREAMLARHAALRHVYEDKNSATSKLMNQLLPLQSCTADAGLLSDKKTFVLIVHAIARNKGDKRINNFNLDTVISGRSGTPLLHRYLNAAKPVAPGEDFNHRWSIELDGKSPVAQALLRDGPLQCNANWQTMVLNSGQMLQVAEVPHPDIPCDKSGHNHPAGFCELPVFLR